MEQKTIKALFVNGGPRKNKFILLINLKAALLRLCSFLGRPPFLKGEPPIMKKRAITLVLSTLFLVSCGTPSSSGSQSASPSASSASQSSEQTEEILLVNGKSKLIGTPKMDPNNPVASLPELEENLLIGNLPTYHRKGKGAVPYVNLADIPGAFDVALSAVIKPGISGEAKTDGYHLYSLGKKGEIILDAKNDVAKIKNGPTFGQPILIDNNGLGGDYISFRGNSIRPSDKTKAYQPDGSAVPEYETIAFVYYPSSKSSGQHRCSKQLV